jgi:hypothetical protein
MLRLTLLLAMGLGIAFLVGGRDLSPDEQAALGVAPKIEVHREVVPPLRVPAPAAPRLAAAPASDNLTLAAPPATPSATPLVSDASVIAAVELAMATDSLDSSPETDAPAIAVDDAAPLSVDAEIAAALSESQIWYVNASKVNVRSGPSTEFEVIGKVVFGDATEILTDPDEEWVKIRIQGDGFEGYIARRFLQNSEPNG